MVDRISKDALGPLIQIGKGGEGVVYRAPEFRFGDGSQAYVYKEYKNRQINATALDRIVDAPKSIGARRQAVVMLRSVWPVAVVMYDDHHLAGVLMPLIPDRFFHQATLRTRTKLLDRQVQHLMVAADKNRAIGISHADRAFRLRICRDIAYVFGLLHGGKIVFGDVNARNILYSLEPTPQVCLLDCDGVRVQGQAPVTQQLHSPDWEPPDDRGTQNVSTDLYKLGLMFLRILVPGDGSSTNRDPAPARGALDQDGRELLERALGAKGQRPTAKDWFEYFNATITGNMPTQRTTGWVRGKHGQWVRAPLR